MDELMRSLEGGRENQSKVEEDIPKEVHGVLAAHIKIARLVESNDAEADSSMMNAIRLHLEVQGQVKSLALSSCLTRDSAGICNQLKHFSIELLPSTSNQAKLQDVVKLELVIPSPLLPGSVSVLARGTLPLTDVIHGSPLSGSCELKDVTSGAVFAVITADWVFCYGRCGFGESYQLKHASHKPGDYLHCSLFPRLTPPEQHVDSSGFILNPHPTNHPIFIPFNKHAQLCVQESSESVKEPSPTLLMQHMQRLRYLQHQLKGKSDRRERLKFLEEIVLSTSTPQQSPSVGVTARGATV